MRGHCYGTSCMGTFPAGEFRHHHARPLTLPPSPGNRQCKQFRVHIKAAGVISCLTSKHQYQSCATRHSATRLSPSLIFDLQIFWTKCRILVRCGRKARWITDWCRHTNVFLLISYSGMVLREGATSVITRTAWRSFRSPEENISIFFIYSYAIFLKSLMISFRTQ